MIELSSRNLKELESMVKELQNLSENSDDIFESLQPWEVIQNALASEIARLKAKKV